MLRPHARLLLSAAALALVSCSGGTGASAPEAAATGEPGEDGVLEVTGTDNLQWDPPALTAPAGEVRFRLVCADRVNHNLVIDADGDRTTVAECGPGGEDDGTLDLGVGEYTFVCTIPGHESSMRGPLTVG
ncbi:MAG: hypothetical protein KG028_14895 [Actinobacteria bacterium]|jgi:plastocyanin|nr:hypothetical protein [Actinomycetota bacterium]